MSNQTSNVFASLPSLPAMPKAKKNKPTRPCACGCGGATKGMWVSGHDGRATGWAIRIGRGILSLGDVPANEQAGALIMLARHGHDTTVYTVPADIRYLQGRRAA